MVCTHVHLIYYCLVLRVLHIDHRSKALIAMERLIVMHGRELMTAYFLGTIAWLFMTAVIECTETLRTGKCINIVIAAIQTGT